jgi:WXG100 family type VII secretion target
MVIRAQWADMRQASADIATTVGQMDSEMATLERTLLNSYQTWDGPTRQAFDNARLEWRAIQADLHTRLALVGRATSGSADEFENAEITTARSTPGVVESRA